MCGLCVLLAQNRRVLENQALLRELLREYRISSKVFYYMAINVQNILKFEPYFLECFDKEVEEGRV